MRLACDGVAAKTAAKHDWGKSKSVKLLRGIMTSMLAEWGAELRPWVDGPTVRALRVEHVRAEFFKAHYADGETEKAKQNAKRMAFKRAVEAAVDKGKIVTREVGGVEYIWLAHADNEAEARTVRPVASMTSKATNREAENLAHDAGNQTTTKPRPQTTTKPRPVKVGAAPAGVD